MDENTNGTANRKAPYQPTDNDKKAQGLFESLADAKAAPVDATDYRVYKITATRDVKIEAGTEFFTNHNAPYNGRANFFAAMGLTIEPAEATGRVVYREKPLSEMSPEELEASAKRTRAELARRKKAEHASTTASKGASAPSEALEEDAA